MSVAVSSIPNGIKSTETWPCGMMKKLRLNLPWAAVVSPTKRAAPSALTVTGTEEPSADGVPTLAVTVAFGSASSMSAGVESSSKDEYWTVPSADKSSVSSTAWSGAMPSGASTSDQLSHVSCSAEPVPAAHSQVAAPAPTSSDMAVLFTAITALLETFSAVSLSVPVNPLESQAINLRQESAIVDCLDGL